jgi:uncharacterized protein YcnI
MTLRLRQAAALAAITVAFLWLAASPAAAHVLLAKAQPNPDGTTTLTFTFDHGCAESPTNGLTINTPGGVTIKSASGPPGWQTSAEATHAAFTGPPIGAGTQAEFLVTVAITGAKVAQSLAFPTIQTCANGETLAWQDTESTAEHPAPALIVTAAMLPAPVTTSTGLQGASLPSAVWAVAVLTALAAAAGFFGATRPVGTVDDVDG